MPQPELDYRKIRRRAEQHLKQEKFRMRMGLFFGNLIICIFFTAIAWGIFTSDGGAASQNDSLMGALFMMTIASFMGLLFNFVSLISDTTRGEQRMRERAYGRAMNEEMMRLGEEDDSPSEKVKHMMQLSDDGELETISGAEDDTDLEAQSKYSAHR